MRRHLAHVGSPPDFAPLEVRKLAVVLVGAAAAVVFVTVVVQDLGLARMVVWTAAAAILGIFGILIARGTAQERKGLVAVFVLTAQGILFFIFYQQMSTSLTLFALRNVDLNFLFGYQIPARPAAGPEPHLDLHPRTARGLGLRPHGPRAR